MQKLVFGAFFLLFLTICQAGSVAAAEGGEDDAIVAAETFLQAMDAGDYEGSWRMTSPLHQARTFRELFIRTVGATRTSFGKLLTRSLTFEKPLGGLPVMPDGTYVLVIFASSYEHKYAISERVTVRLEEDGRWRVCDYYPF